MNQTFFTTIRLNLKNEADRRAWERLKKMDRQAYKSYSRIFVAAVNEFFDRREQEASDCCLDSQKREEAFLQSVLETIRQGFQEATLPNAAREGIPGTLPLAAAARTQTAAEQEEADNAALDFVDSL